MKISVIVPTYKRPVYLKRALDSIVKQTYKNIEIIVVSDNEVDSPEEEETLKIVNNYKKIKDFIYLPAIGNHGSCYARNRGLEIANGEYVNFFDDDDIMYANKIEKQVELLKKHKETVAVIGCYADIVNAKGEKYRVESPIYDKNDILYSQLKRNLCTTGINLINTSIAKEVGGFEYIEASQEHLFLIKVFSVSPSFDYIEEPLLSIHEHDGGRISTNSKRPIGMLKLSKYIEKYYDNYTGKKLIELKAARLAIDARAYCLLKEYKHAWEAYKKRLKIKIFDAETIKIPLLIILYLFGVRK